MPAVKNAKYPATTACPIAAPDLYRRRIGTVGYPVLLGFLQRPFDGFAAQPAGQIRAGENEFIRERCQMPTRSFSRRAGITPADRRAPPPCAGTSPPTAGILQNVPKLLRQLSEFLRHKPDFRRELPEERRNLPELLRELPELPGSLPEWFRHTPESFRHAKNLQKPLFS